MFCPAHLSFCGNPRSSGQNKPCAITCGDNGQLQRKNGVLHLDWKELCEGLMGKYRCLALCKRQQQKRIYLAGETEENKAGSDSENFQHLQTLDNIHWALGSPLHILEPIPKNVQRWLKRRKFRQ